MEHVKKRLNLYVILCLCYASVTIIASENNSINKEMCNCAEGEFSKFGVPTKHP